MCLIGFVVIEIIELQFDTEIKFSQNEHLTDPSFNDSPTNTQHYERRGATLNSKNINQPARRRSFGRLANRNKETQASQQRSRLLTSYISLSAPEITAGTPNTYDR